MVDKLHHHCRKVLSNNSNILNLGIQIQKQKKESHIEHVKKKDCSRREYSRNFLLHEKA